MSAYVVGLLFTPDRQWLALLQKRRPAWQEGRWNGCGGRVESGETPLDAMVRETKEEMAVDVRKSEWRHVLTLHCDMGSRQVMFFAAFSRQALHVSTATDERVSLCHVRDWPNESLMPNLRWIIPLAVDPCIALPLVVADAPSLEAMCPSA